MTFETILYEVKDGVGTLTLNRPERMNGMTNRMVREVYDLLGGVAKSDEARVLVLTGAGRGFCPGADLFHYGAGAGGGDEALDVRHFRVSLLLHEMPQVTVAAINGACAGAGLGWALACDFRFASAAATFSTAFLNVAVAGDMGGPWTLPRLVGAARARELYMLPEKFDAAEALRIGLTTRVFDAQSFRAEVDALAQRLGRAPALALRTMKANFVEAERMGLAEYLDLESERHMRVTASPETQQAFRDFAARGGPQNRKGKQP
jgi:2-(1,2-epoxy-1,2-dihydrophenyl)acetyl-CoA isomerase